MTETLLSQKLKQKQNIKVFEQLKPLQQTLHMKDQSVSCLPIIIAFTCNYTSSAYLVFLAITEHQEAERTPANESMFKGKGENHNWHPMGVRGSFSIKFNKSP